MQIKKDPVKKIFKIGWAWVRIIIKLFAELIKNPLPSKKYRMIG